MVIKELEAAGITDYRFSGPTIEDVFLQLAEEIKDDDGAEVDQHGVLSSTEEEKSATNVPGAKGTEKGGLKLLSGRHVGFFELCWVLFRKRCVIFKSNWFPSVAAFVLPVVAAGLVTLFVKDQQLAGCSPTETSSLEAAGNIFEDLKFFVVGGPSNKLSQTTLARLFAPIYLNSVNTGSGSVNPADGASSGAASTAADLLRNLTIVNSFEEFSNSIVQYRKNITPAGIWLGDDGSRPTLVYRGNGAEMFNAYFGQWVMDMLLTNTTLFSTYGVLDRPFTPGTGNSLQLLVYVSLSLVAYPAFFALYPNLERRHNVRSLQYVTGVRPVPLWLAYTLFDFAIVLAGAAISVGLLAGLAPDLWYHVSYLFLIFILYGIASTVLAYNVSLFSANQLSAYAFTAAGQVIILLLYIIAFICVLAYAPVPSIDRILLIITFVMSALAPIVPAARALFVALNLFATSCDGDQLGSDPSALVRYGGPILYLIIQIIVYFLVLVWVDGGSAGFSLGRIFTRSSPAKHPGDPASAEEEQGDEEVANELVRVKSSASGARDGRSPNSADGLRVVNLIKSFGSNTAVDNVTFGIRHGEVFALLGPNGAGKSTTISVIRGDLKPSGGDVFVEDVSVARHLAAARSHLGVCPQFDALDQMTVEEHLAFYARARGVSDVKHNVDEVLVGVGLSSFRSRYAHALSGGNKRKLSLGIALMGNPSVVLLDEPSSGLDAAGKRRMWRTLATTAPGRSILLTTHSMEEADALAGRAGILAKRMLAMGSVDQLRRRFGDRLYVHLVCRGAPRTSEQDVQRVVEWVRRVFGGSADVEEKTYHGQLRFSIPASLVLGGGGEGQKQIEDEDEDEITTTSSLAGVGGGKGSPPPSSSSAIGRLVVLLEENRAALGVEHFSVSPTTLDQVFLTVVGQHNIKEEGYENKEEKKKWWRFGR
jgi:ABC-type multidrug transport system ATPase subunit